MNARHSVRPLRSRRQLLGLLAALPVAALAAPAATDPIDRPARLSRLAGRSALVDVARAGTRLVAVGERGHVLLSDDQGASWRQVAVPVSVTLTAVHFVDAGLGWAAGHSGVILATRDGGLSWVKQLDGRMALDRLQAARGADAVQRLRADGPDKPFLDLHFFDAQHGLAVGAYGMAFETRDGGATWQPLAGAIDNPDERHLYTVHEQAGTVWLGGEGGLLLRRAPGAAAFEALRTSFRSTVFAVQGAPDGGLVAAGLGGHVHRSTDGGTSWVSSQPAGRAAVTAAAVSGSRLLLVNEAGQLLVSSDGGRQFTARALPHPFPLSALVEAAPGRMVTVGLLGAQAVALSGTTS